jgi:hypothetical protein
MKLDLLTNATVVNDAMRFVSEKSKEDRLTSKKDSEESSETSSTHHLKAFLMHSPLLFFVILVDNQPCKKSKISNIIDMD